MLLWLVNLDFAGSEVSSATPNWSLLQSGLMAGNFQNLHGGMAG